ncbi:MAG: VWA domain-containing protein [Pyrinomonadaceae bacterium]
MKSSISLVSLLLIALASGIYVSNHARAQQQQQNKAKPVATPTPPPQNQNPDVETIVTRRVRLPITVLDKKGQLVPGLTASDFQVLEDKQPQQIESFTDERESLPLYVGVLMDTSPSVAGKLKFEQEAAINFLQTVVRPRKDRAAFITFDHEIKLRQDFTDKLDPLTRAVYAVKKLGTQTSLYDAVWQFCDEKLRSVPGRRALVIITDGDDTYSRATLNDAVDIAQRTETTIFTISTKAGFLSTVPGVEAGQVRDQGDRDLVKLCEETGGAAFFSGDMLALERSFNKVSRELRTQYLITYRPTNERYDGQFRRIDVKLTRNGGGLKVRTRRGYTAQSDNVLTPPQKQ